MSRSTNPRPKVKSLLVQRPTANTRFHIDYDWWDQSNIDLNTYFRSLVASDDMQIDPDIEDVDLVDPATGQVRRVDGFQYLMQAYFNQLPPDFATTRPIVEAVFCVLLANANQPLTAREIAQRIGRPDELVLKTFGGPNIHKGIRPVLI